MEEGWDDGDPVVQGASRWVSQQAERLVAALRGAGVHEVPLGPLPPTCYPIAIPRATENVSLIMSCVKRHKQNGAVPPTFRLHSWENLPRALWRIPPGEPPFGVHVDLNNAFWSFRLPPGVKRLFPLWPGPGLPAEEPERLPFGWKYNPHFCQAALARVLQGVLRSGMLLTHQLDDFSGTRVNRCFLVHRLTSDVHMFITTTTIYRSSLGNIMTEYNYYVGDLYSKVNADEMRHTFE